MKATLFVNGDVTPGTRIFVKDGGLRYDVSASLYFDQIHK
jgi:hypothetical protein